MKEGLKNEILQLHELLQNKGKWYLDFNCPDDSDAIDLVMEAKDNADAELFEMSVNALYNRYIRWRKEEHYLTEIDELFDAFLSDVAYDLALASLAKEDRIIFQEQCNINFKWI